jgi:predicted outer membrane lipoprotein
MNDTEIMNALRLHKPPIRDYPEQVKGEILRDIKSYLRGLEGLTLYDISISLSKLAENVSALTKSVDSLTKDMQIMKWVLGLTLPAIFAILVGVFLKVFVG